MKTGILSEQARARTRTDFAEAVERSDMADSNITRIVLLGNTGSGKSSLANTLFGEDVFPVNHSVNSGTKLCLSKTKTVDGRSLQLIDPPGFFDTDPRSSELSPELFKCISECAPGPHVFLLVLNMEENTKQMAVALTLIYLSDKLLNHTIVVFTHGDQLQEGKKIEDYVKGDGDPGIVVQECGGRCHVIDNKYWNNSQDQYRNNQNQMEELLKTIDQTVRGNRGGHYTNELLQEFKSLPNISDNDNLSSLKNVPMGILLAAFLGAIDGAESRCCLGAAEEAAPDREEPEALESAEEEARHREQPEEGVCSIQCISGGLVRKFGGAAFGFAAGKAYERYGSPTKIVADLTEFTKGVGDLFVQMKRTKDAITGFAG